MVIKRKLFNIIIYQFINNKMLSSYINSNKCVHCLMDKCGNKKSCLNENDKIFVKKISKYVNEPFLLKDLKESINEKNIKIDNFENKDILKNGFIFTTCLFCLKNDNKNVCKNVKEGRYGTYLLENGEKITYCYSDLKNVKHRIQIGLHIDFEFDKKNNLKFLIIKNNNLNNVSNNNNLNNILNNNNLNNVLNNNNLNNVSNNKSYLNILNKKNSEIDNKTYKEYEKLYNELRSIKCNNIYINLLNIQMNELKNIINNNLCNNEILMEYEIKKSFFENLLLK